MAQLLLGGRGEGLDPQALRVEQRRHVPHGAALARGVHALQHQEDPAASAAAPLGEEPLLQLRERVAEVGQRRLAVGLRAVEAGRGARVVSRQVHRTRRNGESCPQRGGVSHDGPVPSRGGPHASVVQGGSHSGAGALSAASRASATSRLIARKYFLR